MCDCYVARRLHAQSNARKHSYNTNKLLHSRATENYIMINKLGLTPADIKEQCTGTAFDGAYFHLNNPDHLANQIVEKTKGAPTTQSEIRNLVEWLLCTWDPSHGLELVGNDIRIDKLGLMSS